MTWKNPDIEHLSKEQQLQNKAHELAEKVFTLEKQKKLLLKTAESLLEVVKASKSHAPEQVWGLYDQHIDQAESVLQKIDKINAIC